MSDNSGPTRLNPAVYDLWADSAMRRQTAVTAHLKIEQLLLFVFARRHWPQSRSCSIVNLHVQGSRLYDPSSRCIQI